MPIIIKIELKPYGHRRPTLPYGSARSESIRFHSTVFSATGTLFTCSIYWGVTIKSRPSLHVRDVEDVSDVRDVNDVRNVNDVRDINEVEDVSDVNDVHDVSDVNDVSDVEDVSDVPF